MQIEEEEEWREVPGYPGVWASSWGRVHRRSREGLKRAGQRGNPTYGSILTDRKTGYKRRRVLWIGLGPLVVSRLVCAAFHGPAPFEDAVAMHLDNDPLNNDPENLEWGTQADNLAAPAYRAAMSRIARDRYFAGKSGLIPGAKQARRAEAQPAA